MSSPEFGNHNGEKLSTEMIRELKAKRFISDNSPVWWTEGYIPDPREVLPFNEFMKRLVHIGECDIIPVNIDVFNRRIIKRDVYLYPEPVVPITLLNLNIQYRSDRPH